MKANKARVLLPWETYTLTLGSMRTLLAIHRREFIDGRAARPLIVRGLATWVGEGPKMRPSLTDRGTELAKNLLTLVKLEQPGIRVLPDERQIFYCHSPPMEEARMLEASSPYIAARGLAQLIASNAPGLETNPRDIHVVDAVGKEHVFTARDNDVGLVVEPKSNRSPS